MIWRESREIRTGTQPGGGQAGEEVDPKRHGAEWLVLLRKKACDH